MGRERLWQMEWMRRVANGTLAEIVPEAEISDRIARTLGFHRHNLNMDQVDPEEISHLQHFVDGINDHLRECYDYSKPTENILYAIPKPREWTIADCITLQRLLSLQMSKNPLVKILNIIIAKALLPEQLETETGGSVFSKPTSRQGDTARNIGEATENNNATDNLKSSPSLPDLLADLNSDEFIDVNGHFDWERLEALTQQFASASLDQCSSTFVINGDHTKSGKPILACDLHSTTNAPSLWFKCRVTLTGEPTASGEKHPADFDANGFAFVGLPYLWAGQNEHIAWGMTPALFAENTDLFVEYIDMSDNTRFRFNGKWQYATPVDEKIIIKGQKEPLVEKVRITSHGPILSGIFRPAHVGATSKREISIAHPSLEEWGDIPIAGFRRITKAKNLQEFKEATEFLDVFPIVLTYADKENNTGWVFTGDVPARPPQSEKWCMFPVGGGNGDNEWLPHNFVNFDNERVQRFYPPISGESATGSTSIGRSFVVSTHSLPNMSPGTTMDKLVTSQRDDNSHGLEHDDESEDDHLKGTAAVSFLGYPCKVASRAHSIRKQILKRMGIDEAVHTSHHHMSSQIASHHEWSMGVCKTLKDILNKFDKKESCESLQSTSQDKDLVDASPTPPTETVLKDARKLTVEDAIKIQSKQWTCPKRIINMLKPLLGKIHISQTEFEAFQVMHPICSGISLQHVEEAKRQMLKWNGSLEADSSSAILIQVFLHELFDLIFSPRLDKCEKVIHDGNSLQEEEDDRHTQQQYIPKSRATKLLLKFGFLDMVSPLSTSGKPELFFDLLLRRFPPNDELIFRSMIHAIRSLRHICPKSKSGDANTEIAKYKLGSSYRVHWRHYIDHSITQGFEIRPKHNKTIGLYALDCESCCVNSTHKRSSNYLGFKANISSNLYRMHSTSAFRMIADLGDLTLSQYLFAPGNSGVMGIDFYDNLVDSFVKQQYRPLFDGTLQGKTLKILPLRRIISFDGGGRSASAYELSEVGGKRISIQDEDGMEMEQNPVEQRRNPIVMAEKAEEGDDTFMA